MRAAIKIVLLISIWVPLMLVFQNCGGISSVAKNDVGSTADTSGPLSAVNSKLSIDNQIAGGDSAACVVVNGEVWCQGSNDGGRLGDGGTGDVES